MGRPTAMIFRVLTAPEYGNIQVNTGKVHDIPEFNYLDMMSGRVSYLHDGSEHTKDSIGMELYFKDLRNNGDAPKKLKKRYGFTIIIKIAPWNDKPVIILPDEDTLILVSNTNIKITPKIMNVLDNDDEAVDLEYTIQYPRDFDTGYFEISDNLGVRARITSFTQDDINEGRLRYIHRGDIIAEINVQVS